MQTRISVMDKTCACDAKGRELNPRPRHPKLSSFVLRLISRTGQLKIKKDCRISKDNHFGDYS